MRVHVQKWGNSLALRIPKAFAEETEVTQGSVVNLTVDEGRLVAVPERRKRVTLASLLSGVTRANLHGETDTGQAVGRESI
jgi:antitoxin MazE